MDNKVRSQRIKTLSRLNSFGFGVKENIGNDVKFKTCVCERDREKTNQERGRSTNSTSNSFGHSMKLQ